MHKFLRSLASLKLAIYLLAAMAGLYAVAAVYGDMEIYSSWMFRLLMAVFGSIYSAAPSCICRGLGGSVTEKLKPTLQVQVMKILPRLKIAAKMK